MNDFYPSDHMERAQHALDRAEIREEQTARWAPVLDTPQRCHHYVKDANDRRTIRCGQPQPCCWHDPLSVPRPCPVCSLTISDEARRDCATCV